MDYKYCVHCGAELRSGAKFCDHCGAKQPQLDDDNNRSASITEGTTRPTRESLHRQQEETSSRPESTEAKRQAIVQTNMEYSGNKAIYNNNQGVAAAYNESGHPNILNSFDVWVKNALHPNICMGRADFWWGLVATGILGIVVALIYFAAIMVAVQSTVTILFLVVYGILNTALNVWAFITLIERLHDTGHSGWNILWSLTGIGSFWVLFLMCKPTNWNSTKWARP